LTGPEKGPIIYYINEVIMNTPNWIKNSGKNKKGRGISKGRIKARRQALRALKVKIGKEM